MAPPSSRALLLIALLVMVAFLLSDSRRLRKARRMSKLTRRQTAMPIHFSCVGRPVGYYADVEFDCRVFHICDNYGRRVPMFCSPHTKFNQMYRVCDWPNNVDCPDSPTWYYVNGAQPTTRKEISHGNSTALA